MIDEEITISKLEYSNLKFRERQIELLWELAIKLEEGEIDGFDFGKEALNIL